MTVGTAMVILGILYVLVRFEGARTFFLIFFGLSLGLIWWVVDFGSDKPQTFFYNSQSHPAFVMTAGAVCPPDRHVWNHWCVK